MKVYLVIAIGTDVDNVDAAFSNRREAERYGSDMAKNADYFSVTLDRLELAPLPTKLLILQILSGRGYVRKRERLREWKNEIK